MTIDLRPVGYDCKQPEMVGSGRPHLFQDPHVSGSDFVNSPVSAAQLFWFPNITRFPLEDLPHPQSIQSRLAACGATTVLRPEGTAHAVALLHFII